MIIDLHCDTLNKLYNGSNFKSDKLTINQRKLIEGKYLLQVFALFINDKKYDINNIDKMIDLYYENLKEHNIDTYNDMISNYQKNIFSSILALEDGGYIRNISDLYYLHKRGVKIICLTWNYENSLGYPHTIDKNLKEFGINVIKEMEKLNMIICVSHLSDKGFYDVYNNTTKPFIASHSNCREIHYNSRNLTNDMIIKINERKGLIGINYYNKFVSSNDVTYIDDLIKHIMHIKSIASIDCIALGSDFDGIDNVVEFTPETIYLLVNKLSESFTEEEVDKIIYKNAAKFFKRILI